jgi:hypothetical protein
MRRIIFVAFVVSLFCSCKFFGGKRVNGNGNVVTRDISVAEFNSIEAGSAMQIRIKQGPASVQLKTDENLQEYFTIKVDGKTLVIEQKSGYSLSSKEEIIVYISAPTFENLSVGGASKLISEGLITADEIELHGSGANRFDMELKASKVLADFSGSSTLNLKGSANDFVTDASGASKIYCLEFITQEADVDVSGASHAELAVEKELKVDASGASHVEYKGNANVKQNSSGASNVKKID